jgi:hypothetical protein
MEFLRLSTHARKKNKKIIIDECLRIFIAPDLNPDIPQKKKVKTAAISTSVTRIMSSLSFTSWI